MSLLVISGWLYPLFMHEKGSKMSKSLSRNPNDPNIRFAFFRTKKQYKKEFKYTKNTFKQDLSRKLEDASELNPNIYRNSLSNLKNLTRWKKMRRAQSQKMIG